MDIKFNKQQVTVWYFVLALVAVVLLQDMFAARRHTETLAYSEFKALLQAGKVSDVVVTDTSITGRLSTDQLNGLLPAERLASIRAMSGEEHYFVTVKVDDPRLVADLQAAKVRFAGKIESRLVSTMLSWVVPSLLFFALWSFLMKRMGGAQGMLEIGKSKAKVYMQKQTGVTFDDVAGIDEAKTELMEVVEFLRTPDRYRRLGGKIPKGVMLVGAPALLPSQQMPRASVTTGEATGEAE